jgi:transcriptional regulator with XRE-family HTH domain
MPETVLKEFGSRVTKLRLKRGLSQEQLADITGLHRTQISLIERGRRSPRLDTIIRLAKALNINPAKLIPFDRKEK